MAVDKELEELHARWATPLSPKERDTASEVFDQYEGIDRVAAWNDLRMRALETSRPFRAYDCAHAVASKHAQYKENTNDPQGL